MIIWNSFEKKYPLLNKYINDDNIRNNMLKNKDLLRKYCHCEDSIRVFIYELEKYFDIDTISSMISDTVLKLPDNVLLSFIQSYLESDETSKCNPDVLVYYKKISQFGVAAVKYMELNGIITDRRYKQIPEIVKLINANNLLEEETNKHKELNQKYESIKNEDIKFNNVSLDDIFTDLSLPEKQFVIDLITSNNINLFIDLFDRFDYHFKTLIIILVKLGIDTTIISNDNLDKFSMYELMILLYELIDYDDSNIVSNVKTLINQGKIDLVKRILDENCIKYLCDYTTDELEDLNVDDIFKYLVNQKELRREA